MTNFGKDWRPSLTGMASTKLADRVDELRSTLRIRDPGLVAGQSGVSYLKLGADRGEFHLAFWDGNCILSLPELTGCLNHDEPLSDFQMALLLYYLVTADGAPLTGKWVSFAQLPGGRMYSAAFQGYSGDELVKSFGLDLDGFKLVCLNAGGKPVDVGSASFAFQALPNVSLMITYWLGDEEFSSSCRILFDESACHYLPIDVCAVLGSMLTRKLMRSKFG